MIRVSYKLKSGDYARVAAANARRSVPAMVVGLAMAVLGVLWTIAGQPTGLFAATVGGVILTGFVVVPVAWGITARNSDVMLGDVDLTVNQDHMEMRSGELRLALDWSHLDGVRKIGGAFLVWFPTGATFPIPRRAFTDAQADEFSSILSGAGLMRVDDSRRRALMIILGASIVVGLLIVPSLGG